MKRIRAEFSIELDDDRLEAYKLELIDKGEDLYVYDPLVDREVRHWPGYPDEWDSITDVVDLMGEPALAILRTELVSVTEAPAGLAVDGKRHRPRWLAWLPFGVAILAALAIASSGNAATIVGTDGDDVLVGTAIADVMKGLAGDDVIRGRRGDDGLLGGPGADRIIAGRGHDYIEAGRGDDFVDLVDGRFDLLDSCGDGADVVQRDELDFVALDCEDVTTEPAP